MIGFNLMLGDGLFLFLDPILQKCLVWLVLLHLYFYILGWQGTVEERMEAVQARKQRMISGALTDQEVRSARIEELKMLFS